MLLKQKSKIFRDVTLSQKISASRHKIQTTPVLLFSTDHSVRKSNSVFTPICRGAENAGQRNIDKSGQFTRVGIRNAFPTGFRSCI